MLMSSVQKGGRYRRWRAIQCTAVQRRRLGALVRKSKQSAVLQNQVLPLSGKVMFGH